jgi:fucose permease
VSVFAIHLLGDAISPLIVGALSDAFSLQQAITILPVAVLVGGVVWIWAARAQAASKDLSLEPVS